MSSYPRPPMNPAGHMKLTPVPRLRDRYVASGTWHTYYVHRDEAGWHVRVMDDRDATVAWQTPTAQRDLEAAWLLCQAHEVTL